MKVRSKGARMLAGVVLAGGTAGIVAVAATSDAAPPRRVSHATAVLRDASNNVVGSAKFTEDATGRVHVNVHVSGISTGLHGIHVHAIGDCTPGAVAPYFLAAGGHHNPDAQVHGHHNGDLPNLVVNGAGQGHLNSKVTSLTLSPGDDTVFDTNRSALIVHAMADDGFTDPTGNSGARIACGVIVAGP